MLVIVRDVEKESEIESEGLQKKAFFSKKTRFVIAEMAKNACFACVTCGVCIACVACVACVACFMVSVVCSCFSFFI